MVEQVVHQEQKNSRERITIASVKEQFTAQFQKLRLPTQTLVSFALAYMLLMASPQEVQAQYDPDVSGSRPVEACEFPDLASITTPDNEFTSSFCSASLVDEDGDGLSQALLVSAHCIESVIEQDNPSQIIAKVGHDRTKAEPLWITDMAVHPSEDLAVLQLQKPITDTTCVAGAEIGTDVNFQTEVTLAGFGKTNPFSTELPDIAHTGTTYLHTTSSICTRYDPDLLCYGDPDSKPSEDSTVTQPGDSGSAVRQNNKIIGVTAIGSNFEAVGGAVDVTKQPVRNWTLDTINKFDTGKVEPIPPATQVTFEPTYEDEYIVGEEQQVSYFLEAKKILNGVQDNVHINNISAQIHFPCFDILSIEDSKGESLITAQDGETTSTITFTPLSINTYADELNFTVKAHERDGCTHHPFGIGAGYFDAKLTTEMTYGDAEIEKQVKLHNVKHPEIFTPFTLPVEFEEYTPLVLYENVQGSKKIEVERIGDALHVKGYTDLGNRFLIQVNENNHFVEGTPLMIMDRQIGTLFDEVIIDAFKTTQEIFIPYLEKPRSELHMPSIQK